MLAALLDLIACLLLATVTSELEITLLHTNDVHARFVPFNIRGGRCMPEDQNSSPGCFGGAARRLNAVRQLRRQYSNVILLDGGDQYQGTLWYTLLRWEPIALVMNAIGYDAMAFGNHEFDNGLKGLAPFVRNLSFPVVNTNIDATGTILSGTYRPALYLNVENQIVGILGYTTTETPWLSTTENLKFSDEVEALKTGVKQMKASGIKHIIAVGHAGITVDRDICKRVPGIDIVVGGHTNTFLYNGKQPSSEVIEGPYPEVYSESGNKCLVVQDYAFGKYLGFLQVKFDSDGNVQSWKGNPILLDSTFPEDPDLKEKLQVYELQLKEYRSRVIAYTAVAIDGSRKACRLKECNLGNMVADASVFAYLNRGQNRSEKAWTEASIAIYNGGGVRDFMCNAHYNITLEDIYTILPFGNTIEMVTIKGKHLKEVFEYAVQDYNRDDAHGKFLQISGIRILYDLRQPDGQRVRSIYLRCSECTIPRYEPLNPEKIYNVITNSYISHGGDGYSIFKKNIIDSDGAELVDIDVVVEYLKQLQPLTTGIESRIRFVGDKYDSLRGSQATAAASTFVSGDLPLMRRLIMLLVTTSVVSWSSLI